MTTTKRERQMEARLGFVRNRIPGRKRIEELRRIALELRIEAEESNLPYPQALVSDAMTLEAVADLLDQLRIELRGPSRHDLARVKP